MDGLKFELCQKALKKVCQEKALAAVICATGQKAVPVPDQQCLMDELMCPALKSKKSNQEKSSNCFACLFNGFLMTMCFFFAEREQDSE